MKDKKDIDKSVFEKMKATESHLPVGITERGNNLVFTEYSKLGIKRNIVIPKININLQ